MANFWPANDISDKTLAYNIAHHENKVSRGETIDVDDAARLAELYEERKRRFFVSLPQDIVSIYDILSQYRDKDGVK